MLRDAAIKIGGATFMLLGISFFTLGILTASKFMQATGFMCGIISLALLYYTWASAGFRPVEEEPPEARALAREGPLLKQKL